MRPAIPRRSDSKYGIGCPAGCKQYERIEKRREMISVREEADGFRQIGECEKAQGAGRALRHLKQPKEGANNTDRQHNQAHQTSLGVGK
jgi:hypothetical protein